MLIAVFVGVLSGLIGTVCWLVVQLLLNMPGLHAYIGASWFVVPLLIGVIAAALHSLARAFQTRGVSDRSVHTARLDRRQSLCDVFESYHFGIFILHPLNWLARGAVSLVNAFLGGTFGVEGGVLELSFSTLPMYSRYVRLFVEEKQTFVICTIAASLSVALGAPFSGGLIALELVNALEARVRSGAIMAALIAYGTTLLFQGTLLAGVFADTPVERLNVMGALFNGLKPMNLELSQWTLLSVAAVCVGVGSGMFAALTSRALEEGVEFFSRIFSGRFRLGMILTGALISLTVLLVPESFVEPWRVWEDLAWMRFSSSRAIILLAAEWALFVLAFSGWGSAGLISPILLFGALFGYAAGNAVGVTWAVPMAISGAAAALAGLFRVPIGAAALVLEIGHDGPMWWLATLSVLASYLITRAMGVKPFHELLLERTGLRLLAGRAVSVLANLKSADAMFTDIQVIHDRAGIQDMRAAAAVSRHNFLGVVSSSDGKYVGLLPLEQLPGRVRHVLRPDARAADILAVERVVEISDLIDTHAPCVRPDETLESASGVLSKAPCAAVVDRDGQLRGFLFETSIAAVYKREVARTVIRQS